MNKDFYQILGIAKDASDEAVRESFEQLALKYKPNNDGVTEDDTNGEFESITQAFEVLNDAQKRKAYDDLGEDRSKESGTEDAYSSTGSSGSDHPPDSKNKNGGEHPPVEVPEKPSHDTNGTDHQNGPPDVASNVPRIQNGERNSFKSSIRKPVAKTNLVIIKTAMSKALEGPANSKLLKKIQDAIDAQSKTCDHFLILFKDRQQFRGIYKYDQKQQTITKLEGVGPKTIRGEDIVRYFKFDYSKRQFLELQTKNIGPTTIAILIQESFWFKHRQRIGN